MNKRWTRAVGVLLSMALTASSVAAAAPASFAAQQPGMSIAQLEVNKLTAPMGLDQNPTFSWGLNVNENGRGQSAYRLIVATTPEKAAAREGDIWDTGKTKGENNFDIAYAGPALSAKTAYYWAVQVWDDQGSDVGWSGVSSFETGLLSPSDWKGEWIGDSLASETVGMKVDGCNWIWSRYGAALDQTPEGHLYFRKKFTVDPEKTVVKAVFGYTVDDKGQFYLNGSLIGGSDAWESGAAFNITDKVVPGENTIAVDGHNTSLGYGGFIGKLVITYADGDTQEMITDSSWKLTNSPAGGWEQPGFDDSGWGAPDQVLPYGSAPWNNNVNIETTVTETTSAPLFRKEFEVKGDVESARAYVCGLGLFDLRINGKTPDDTVLNPAHTQYDKRVFYQVFDVKDMLNDGANAIGVELGKSFYNETVSTWNWQNAVWRDNPKLRMQIEIRYADGRTDLVATGKDWKVASDGPTVFDSIYYGETYDARLEKNGFDRTGYTEDESWHDAKIVDAPAGEVLFQQMEPMRRVREFTPEVAKLDNGSYIITNPEMATGWSRISFDAPAGTEVTITYGERLNADGTLAKQGNDGWFYRTIQQDKYICKGEPGETFEPRFSYKGYKYIQVDGYPGELTADQVTNYLIHNDVDVSGSFSSSSEQVNALHQLMVRTMLNNFQGKPTDTPVWEKNGWTGDANVTTETMAYNFDIGLFMSKFLNDLEDTQTGNAIGNIAPSADWSIENTPVWNNIYFLATLQLYDQYGMLSFTQEQYDNMSKFMQVTLSTIEANHWVWVDGQMGDWVGPSGGDDPNAGLTAMAPEGSGICGTGYVYESLKAMARMADLLGKPDDAEKYRDAMSHIYDAFNAKYYHSDENAYYTTTWDANSQASRTRYRQTSQLVPLAFGLVPEEHRQAVADRLARDVEERGYHLDTGMVGTKLLLPVLSDNGHADVAFRVLTQTTYPSWGFWLEQGTDSAWEGYEITARSRDHYFLGTYDEWMFKGLAGIRDFQDGGKSFVVKPQLANSLTWVKAGAETARGAIASAWEINPDGSANFDFSIPAGATAELYLPTAKASGVLTKDGAAVTTEFPGVLAVSEEDGLTKVTVGSGSYAFVSATEAAGRYTLELQEAVDYAKGLSQADYEQDAWQAFQATLDAALDCLDSADNQYQINQCAAELSTAMETLKGHINQTRVELKALIAELSVLKAEHYSGDYWSVFQRSYDEAKDRAADMAATDDQLRRCIDELHFQAQTLAYYRVGNIALGGKPTASSTINNSNGWHIDYLTDGDRKNLSSTGEICGWTSNNDTANNHEEWIAVDLGSKSRFDTLTLYPSAFREDSPCYGMPVDFDIQVSDDGQQWETVHSERDYPLPDYGPQTFTFPSSYARYVRVYGYSLHPKATDNNLYRMQITELELYNTPLQPATLGNLAVSNGSLSPAFDPSVRDYTLRVPNDVSSIRLDCAVSGNGTLRLWLEGSEVSLENNTLELREGENRLRIDVVTDGSLETQSTHLTVVRESGGSETGADKAILKRVIAYADGAKASGEYGQAIESVRASFDRALDYAKEIEASASASQQQVDAAWIALMTEIHKLGFIQGNKEGLTLVAETAEGLNLADFVDAGKTEFRAALAAAQALLDDGDAMQAELNDALADLIDVMASLRLRADKSLLNRALARAEAVDEAAYTPESVAKLRSAATAAQAAADDTELSTEDQAYVNRVARQLDEAVSGLVPLTGSPASTTGTGVPATGDAASLPAAAFVLALTGALLRKKKQK